MSVKPFKYANCSKERLATAVSGTASRQHVAVVQETR